MLSDALEATGLVCLTCSAFLIALPLGIAAAGISLILLGLSFADRDNS